MNSAEVDSKLYERVIPICDLSEAVSEYARSCVSEITKPRRGVVVELHFRLDETFKTRRRLRHETRGNVGEAVLVLTAEWFTEAEEQPAATEIADYLQRAEAWLRKNPPPGLIRFLPEVNDRSEKTVLSAAEVAAVSQGLDRVFKLIDRWNGVQCDTGSWLVRVMA